MFCLNPQLPSRHMELSPGNEWIEGTIVFLSFLFRDILFHFPAVFVSLSFLCRDTLCRFPTMPMWCPPVQTMHRVARRPLLDGSMPGKNRHLFLSRFSQWIQLPGTILFEICFWATLKYS